MYSLFHLLSPLVKLKLFFTLGENLCGTFTVSFIFIYVFAQTLNQKLNYTLAKKIELAYIGVRFAPAGFSHMVDGKVQVGAWWVPYYYMRLTVATTFKARLLMCDGSFSEIIVDRQHSYEDLTLCGAPPEHEHTPLIQHVDDYSFTALPLPLLDKGMVGKRDPTCLEETKQNKKMAVIDPTHDHATDVGVMDIISVGEAWKYAEKKIIAKEKDKCRQQITMEHNPQKIQQMLVTKIVFKDKPSYSIIYAPVYFIRYTYKGKRYPVVILF